MLEDIEHSELNRLTVFFPETLDVLSHLDLWLLVAELWVGLRVARELGLRYIEPLKNNNVIKVKYLHFQLGARQE